jgi:copper chaperone CopZ
MSIIYRLFALALSLLPLSMSAEIFQVRLTIEGMKCTYCGRSCTDELKKIKGVDEVHVWPLEGLAAITWKSNYPFQSVQLFRTMNESHFLLKALEVDVEGTVEKKKGAWILRSEPDNSIFYIDNAGDPQFACLKEGYVARLKGVVKNQQGFNFMTVLEVLPEVR